jgi:multicomponent Na+:H+ antiporter subunit B
MGSIVLKTAGRSLTPILFLASLALLLRGHNAAGGGFAGGLVAAVAVVLRAIARDPGAGEELLRADTQAWLGTGLLLILGSGVAGLAAGAPFLTAQWGPAAQLGGGFEVSLGTPLLFDMGVYACVIGVVSTIVLRLFEE